MLVTELVTELVTVSGCWRLLVTTHSVHVFYICLTGGLSAVIWTDFIQVFIMIIGAFVLMAISKFLRQITEINVSTCIVIGMS